MRLSSLLTNVAHSLSRQYVRSAAQPFIASTFIIAAFMLVACGGSTGTNNRPALASTSTRSVVSTPTHTPTPPPTPTPKPTPTFTPIRPTPTHPAYLPAQPTSIPTQPPMVPAPILDVAPASMSIVGHLDCNKTATVYVCQAAVISRASNQAPLHWVAFANVAGVSFSPAQGTLAPGTRMLLTINIPVEACSATFFFQGPVNTHTIVWQC